MHAQTETVPQTPVPEPELAEILALVELYSDQMKTHPLHAAFADPRVSRDLVEEFAGIQYVDSVLWVPMLAVMKDRVKNEKLYQALLDNLLCEAGAAHKSHVRLCQEFVQSVGVSPFYGNFREYSDLAGHAVEMMNAISGLNEAQIAGFNLMSEAVVPHLFRMALPAFRRIPECDTTYLTDHITVDADDHAAQMVEAVRSLVVEGSEVGAIMEGIHLSGRTALSVPDALFAKHARGAYRQRMRRPRTETFVETRAGGRDDNLERLVAETFAG